MPRANNNDDPEHPRNPLEADGRYLRYFSQKLSELLIQGERAHYEQGRFIDESIRGRYWDRWPEGQQRDFKTWCWKVLGYRSRKGEILRRNFLLLSAMNVAEDTLVRALRLGWTKLSHILKVATDENTLLRWIDRVENEGLSEDDLRALTKQGDDAGEAAPKPVAFRLVFEEQQALDTFMLALKAIKKRYDPEMGWGRASALMATSYAATMPRDDEGGAPVELNDLLIAIENTYRVRLSVANTQPQPSARVSAPVAPPTSNNDAVRSASLEM
jgi:hypothetical protein